MTSKPKKKKVDFSVRPRANRDSLPANPDQWVMEGREASPASQQAKGKQKRLTMNLPAGTHTAFKGRCVLEGVTIQDKVQALIEAYLAEQSATAGQGPPSFDSTGNSL